MPVLRYPPASRGLETQIHQMRLRIEKERTPHGPDNRPSKPQRRFDGCGIHRQVLCLENGLQEANTLRALERRAMPGRCRMRQAAWKLPQAAARRGYF